MGRGYLWRPAYRDKKTGEMKTSNGIHSVFSGFNEAYRAQAQVNKWEIDPIVVTTGLADTG